MDRTEVKEQWTKQYRLDIATVDRCGALHLSAPDMSEVLQTIDIVCNLFVRMHLEYKVKRINRERIVGTHGFQLLNRTLDLFVLPFVIHDDLHPILFDEFEFPALSNGRVRFGTRDELAGTLCKEGTAFILSYLPHSLWVLGEQVFQDSRGILHGDKEDKLEARHLYRYRRS